MKKILILETNDQTNLATNYLPQKILQQYGLQLTNTTCDTTEQMISTNEFAALFISLDSIDLSLITKLLNKELPISTYLFYNSQTQNHLSENISTWCSTFNFIGSIVDTSIPNKFIYPLLREIAQKVDKNDLIETSNYLNTIEEKVSSQLAVIKKMHAKMVPRRFENFKGVKICSKFGIGASNGGDFLDLASDNNQLIIILSSTNSYLVNTIILDVFSSFKSANIFNQESMDKLLTNLEKEVSPLTQTKNSKKNFELLLVKIDLKKLTINGYNFGNTISCGKSDFSINRNSLIVRNDFFNNAKFQSSLKRDDKIFILSPGLIRNIPDNIDPHQLISKIYADKNDNSFDILNNIFVEILDSKNGNFFKDDAFAIAIEVDSNVIFET